MRKYIFLLLLTCCSLLALAQTRTVRGTVTNGKDPLQGVSVFEKDVTNNGAITDEKGHFQINLRGRGVLMIQSVGFVTQEVAVNNRNEITITLAVDAKGMEDIVVVGYGTKRKLTNIGAVSGISGDELQQTPTASLQNGLMGRVTGIVTQQRSGQPGSDGAGILIRGLSTTNGPGTPLIIVDDLEFTGLLSEIDPDQIANISFLKDASSTAVFGVKGANGVIVITTRRGRNGKPSIMVRSEFGGQRPTFFPKYLDSYQTALLRNEALANDSATTGYWTDADLEAFRTGSDPYGHPNVDWADLLLRPYSVQSQNNLNISGGAERAKYFISAGYLFQNGMVKDFTVDEDLNSNYYYKRYNFRSNFDFTATKTLTLNVDLSGNFAERNEPNIGGRNNRNNVFFEISDYNQLPPFAYQPFNPDGSYGANSTPGIYSNNIIGRLALGGYNRAYDNTLTANLRATQKLDFLTKGLSIRAILG